MVKVSFHRVKSGKEDESLIAAGSEASWKQTGSHWKQAEGEQIFSIIFLIGAIKDIWHCPVIIRGIFEALYTQ